MQSYLDNHPDKDTAEHLSLGFRTGFHLNYTGLRLPLKPKNMKSAQVHIAELLAIINKEISLGRMSEPFNNLPMFNLRCNPVGILPKKDGCWRLITNLSAPTCNSVNDFIDPALCSVSYASFDHAITMISSLGKATLLCKMDLSNAFHLLPIHSLDFCLLGMCIEGKYYFDKCMPFGCAIACSTFEKFSSFLHWVLAKSCNSPNIMHYLDDFLFAGSRDTSHCTQLAVFSNIVSTVRYTSQF